MIGERHKTMIVVIGGAWWCSDCCGQAVFRVLGRLDGSDTHAASVSSDGRFVAGNALGRVFRWSEEGGMETLGPLPPPFNGSPLAAAISRDGSMIVGRAKVFSQKGFPTGAFIWTTEGGMRHLGPPGGGIGSWASGISDDGTVFGNWDLIDGLPFMYAWTEDKGFRRLTEGAQDTFDTFGVSGDGSTVVGGALTAMRWTQATGTESLGDLPGGQTAGRAYDASFDGAVIVGGSRSARSNPIYEFEAFRWTAEGGMIGLGALPSKGGWFLSEARAVTADGSVIVGQSSVGENPGSQIRAFIWTAETGIRSLRDVLVTEFGLGMQLVGWSLWTANDISPDGRFIVGLAAHEGGDGGAYIVDLGPPCRADFNGDGVLNSQDFFDYLAAFFTTLVCADCPNTPCRADFNRDCAVTSGDFFDFLAAFFAGCG